MELWQFKFPDANAPYNGYVYTFESKDRLVREGGNHVEVAYWDGNIPVARDFGRAVRVDEPTPAVPEKSGGSVDYYQVRIEHPTTEGRDPYTAECNDIIEALGMNYAEGNQFKALWRSCAARTLGKLKAGGDAVYDAEKSVFFAKRILTQRKKEAACN